MLNEALRILPNTDEYGFPISKDPPASFDDQARLLAYASDEVREAFEASRGAGINLSISRANWMIADEEARGVLESANPDVAQRKTAAKAALENAAAPGDKAMLSVQLEDMKHEFDWRTFLDVDTTIWPADQT